MRLEGHLGRRLPSRRFPHQSSRKRKNLLPLNPLKSLIRYANPGSCRYSSCQRPIKKKLRRTKAHPPRRYPPHLHESTPNPYRLLCPIPASHQSRERTPKDSSPIFPARSQSRLLPIVKRSSPSTHTAFNTLPFLPEYSFSTTDRIG